jgi:hypothetical protein
MDQFVRLDRLPDGLEFPADLLDRVSHDAARQTLSFRGFMSKADFDRLSRLSEDWGYRRSLEELFRLCSLEPETRPTNRIAAALARLIPGRNRLAN